MSIMSITFGDEELLELVQAFVLVVIIDPLALLEEFLLSFIGMS